MNALKFKVDLHICRTFMVPSTIPMKRDGTYTKCVLLECVESTKEIKKKPIIFFTYHIQYSSY